MMPRGLFLGLLVLAILFGGTLAVIAVANAGHAIYTLDDPYIHLALSENLLRGHYGVNLGEMSAPSSSILWPFLLVPFQAIPWGEFAPLFLNAVFAVLIVATFHALLRRTLGEISAIAMALALAAVIAATRTVGVAFTGMEHVLQAWLAAMTALGLVIEVREDRMPRWLPVILVLGPLVRYESLDITVPVAAYLMTRGRRQVGITILATTAILLGGFSLWLVSRGLSPLPSSVIEKVGAGGGHFFASRFNHLLAEHPSKILMMALVPPTLGLLLPGINRRNRVLAGLALAAALAHMIQGRYGATARYQFYVLLYTLGLCLQVYAPFLARLRDSCRRLSPRGQHVALSLAALAVLGLWLVTKPGTVVGGARNIYAQQFQMHRFVTEYLHAPVAVNDLGWVSYHNDLYVLDLWGLANPEALHRRSTESGTAWVDSLALLHGVRLAMVYDAWVGDNIPASWTRLGTLRLEIPQVTVSRTTVAFYAVHPVEAPAIRTRLVEFAATLPPSARFVFDPARASL